MKHTHHTNRWRRTRAEERARNEKLELAQVGKFTPPEPRVTREPTMLLLEYECTCASDPLGRCVVHSDPDNYPD